MASKMTYLMLGGLLILIALILLVVQHFGMYNFYGDPSNKWYFYGLDGLIGLIGIILAALPYIRKQPAPTPS
jgi:hypothetical protein